MPALPVEIIEKVLYYVLWSPVEEPSLKTECWETGTDSLLPTAHPLHAVATRKHSHVGQLEQTLVALKCSSKQLRQMVLAHFRAYFKQIHTFPVSFEYFCSCRHQEEAQAAYLEHDEDCCRDCGDQPSPRWILCGTSSFDPAQQTLGIERLCQCTNGPTAGQGEECEVCDRNPTTRWILSKPSVKENHVKALLLSEEELETTESGDEPEDLSTTIISRYTNLVALELGSMTHSWAYDVVTTLIRRSPGLRQVRLTDLSRSPFWVFGWFDMILSALAECTLELLDAEVEGDRQAVTQHVDDENHVDAPLFTFVVARHSTLRHLRLVRVRSDQPDIQLQHKLLDPGFVTSITRLSLDHVHADALLLRILVERCSSTLEYLSLWDTEMDRIAEAQAPQTFKVLKHFTIGVSDPGWEWHGDACEVPALGARYIPPEWSVPALLSLDVYNLSLSGGEVDAFSEQLRQWSRKTLKYVAAGGRYSQDYTTEEDGAHTATPAEVWQSLLQQELQALGCESSLAFRGPEDVY